jgi:hypothetical protein
VEEPSKLIPLGKLNRVLLIALLVVFGCEETTEENTTFPFQTFSKTYGTGSGLKIRDNTNGEFYSILSNLNAYNPNGSDVYDYAIVNTDYLGEEIDRIFLDLDSTFRPNGHNFTTDNGIVTIGDKFEASYKDDIYIVKYNAAGTIEWTKRIGGDTESEYLPPYELWESDSSCAVSLFYQGISMDNGFGITQTSDNGYILTACFECYVHRATLYVIKLDESGNYEWMSCYFNGGGWDVLEIDDGYLVTGVIVDQEYISDYSDAFLLSDFYR